MRWWWWGGRGYMIYIYMIYTILIHLVMGIGITLLTGLKVGLMDFFAEDFF